MNYEVVAKQVAKKNLMGSDLEIGTAAIITSPGIYEGRLVIKCGSHRLQDITDPKCYWDDGGRDVNVRLLAEGEVYEIRGK
jgi:hypothetical protein